MKRRYGRQDYLGHRGARPGSRSGSGHLVGLHRRVPRRDRGGLRRHARSRCARAIRERLRIPLLPEAGDRVRAVGERDRRPARGRLGTPAAAPGSPGGDPGARSTAISSAGGSRSCSKGTTGRGRGAGAPLATASCTFRTRAASFRPAATCRSGSRRGLPNSLIGNWPVSRGKGAEGRRMVKMEIKGLLMDPVSNMPVVILRDAATASFSRSGSGSSRRTRSRSRWRRSRRPGR